MNLTLKELARFVSNIPKAATAAAIRGARNGAQQAIPVLQRAGDRAPPASPRGSVGAFDTGKYRRSWRVTNIANGCKLYNSSPYADVVERGRRRGRKMPPRRVIEAWAQRKLGLSSAQAKQAAYPIARAIGRRGLKGRHVEQSARPQVMRIVMREVKLEIAKAMRKAK